MKHEKDIELTGEEMNVFLNAYFSYYRTLGVSQKVLFVRRLLEFVRSKSFISPKGLPLTNKVKVIVSASAVQLTLGLENWKISYFDTIILFPTDFKNEITGLTLKGETNLNGFVSFSWKSFIEGYRIPNDNLNLGLHEFTHALRFNGVRGQETDAFFDGYFPKWFSYAKQEFANLKNGGNSIFRKYGGTNINEFLSVVVEHFFESPAEFIRENPDLYSATAIMLNQKTDGMKTLTNIREEELKKLSCGLTIHPVEIKRGLPPLGPPSICLLISVFTGYSAGVFSFPFISTFFSFLLVLLREDFRYRSFTVDAHSIYINSGFLFFKRARIRQIGVSQLIKAEFFESDGNERTVSLTYFEQTGEFFEESAYIKLDDGAVAQFSSDLKGARVLVK